MGYESWHIYGYGICVSDIQSASLDRLILLLERAPRYHQSLKNLLTQMGIDTPTYDDYMETDVDYMLGLATIMSEVIAEAESIHFLACNSQDCDNYLVYAPKYPWKLPQNEQSLTEERIAEILTEYVNILTDEEIIIDYQAVENGG